MEEWQDPDSGYLNCIGVGDTYVKRQMERILNENCFRASEVVYYPYDEMIDLTINNVRFIPKIVFGKKTEEI